MIPEIKRQLAGALTRPRPRGLTAHWLAWRRRRQARSRWFHRRARLNREYALVR
jgi:phage baseplate assembly protein gpV